MPEPGSRVSDAPIRAHATQVVRDRTTEGLEQQVSSLSAQLNATNQRLAKLEGRPASPDDELSDPNPAPVAERVELLRERWRERQASSPADQNLAGRVRARLQQAFGEDPLLKGVQLAALSCVAAGCTIELTAADGANLDGVHPLLIAPLAELVGDTAFMMDDAGRRLTLMVASKGQDLPWQDGG